jgi:hypothetical protein
MRFDPKKSFGHPVLRKNSSDYIESDISSSIELINQEVSPDVYNLEYHVMLGVSEIRRGVQDRSLIVVVNVFCAKTMFRQSFITSELVGSLPLNVKNIRGDLDIDVEVVVNSESYELRSEKIHPEFGGSEALFTLKKGDLIAQAWPAKLFIDREVFQSVVSLFEWATQEDLPDGAWRMGVTEDSVKIEVNAEQRVVLTQGTTTKSGRALLLNAIFLPALVQLIQDAMFAEVDENVLWFKVLVMKLSSIGETLTKNSDPISLAQRLLKYPLSTVAQTGLWEH